MEELNFMDGINLCYEAIEEIIKRNKDEKADTIKHEIEELLFFIEGQYNSERAKYLMNKFKIKEELSRWYAIVQCVDLQDKVESMKVK